MVELLEVLDDLNVEYGANVKGKATWKNISLAEGTALVAVFFLGKGGSTYSFTYGGVEYLIGSLVSVAAPSIGASVITEIPSKAMFSDVWDAQVMIGVTSGTVRTVQFEGRIVGLNRADVIDSGYLSYYAAAWYTGVLTVGAPAAPVQITAFEFVAG
jgi:hypothetical protein